MNCVSTLSEPGEGIRLRDCVLDLDSAVELQEVEASGRVVHQELDSSSEGKKDVSEPTVLHRRDNEPCRAVRDTLAKAHGSSAHRFSNLCAEGSVSPASRRSQVTSSPGCRRIKGLGASSRTFWWRRCTLHCGFRGVSELSQVDLDCVPRVPPSG